MTEYYTKTLALSLINYYIFSRQVAHPISSSEYHFQNSIFRNIINDTFT